MLTLAITAHPTTTDVKDKNESAGSLSQWFPKLKLEHRASYHLKIYHMRNILNHNIIERGYHRTASQNLEGLQKYGRVEITATDIIGRSWV